MTDETQKQIGDRLRKIRKSKGLTINYVAKETGFTSSFISQLERGLTKASVAALQKITKSLGVTLSVFFQEDTLTEVTSPEETVKVVRKQNRRKLTYPDSKSTDYLLAETNGSLEVINSKVEPNGGSGELFSHEPAEECILVLNGQLDVTVGENEYTLYQGDTITFPSRIPHGWKNNGSVTAELIWIVTPPNY